MSYQYKIVKHSNEVRLYYTAHYKRNWWPFWRKIYTFEVSCDGIDCNYIFLREELAKKSIEDYKESIKFKEKYTSKLKQEIVYKEP